MATATTTSTNAASYGDCVAALRTSLSFLESSVSTLGTGVADFPRLINVLKSVRHYELIPQPTLVAAEASLRDEIGPAITTLLDRADSHIARVERRIDALKAKSELQQGRLLRSSSPTPPSRPVSRNAGKPASANARGGGGGGGRRASLPGDRLTVETKLRARQREALQYSVERLELEVLQKERELRKRLDAAS
ncbi:DASH complex subunit Spc19 [Annulohypoxylon truncatum]|uniref:DASH complex subunit Spc19 n=1 Tax=Annulohypoxylon truncatum TaxID=327061 RepID=UPI00200753A2|nr:DASH complex subunit Spc19 [Annulohypoxylon truncatum]KAI1206767.1 DASH complex subunit Spc19 [Annulohypoxylon truncatum]